MSWCPLNGIGNENCIFSLVMFFVYKNKQIKSKRIVHPCSAFVFV